MSISDYDIFHCRLPEEKGDWVSAFYSVDFYERHCSRSRRITQWQRHGALCTSLNSLRGDFFFFIKCVISIRSIRPDTKCFVIGGYFRVWHATSARKILICKQSEQKFLIFWKSLARKLFWTVTGDYLPNLPPQLLETGCKKN